MLFSKLNLDPGETILLEVRRHWFVFVLRSVGVFVLAILPIVLFVVLISLVSQEIFKTIELYMTHFIFFYCIWFMFMWMVFFIQWTNYYLDVWFITEKRIIDVEQKRVFHREVSNLRFDKIQDISIEVRGVIATFLNFGDLRVQTAAEDSSDFFMKNASRPEEVRKVIFSRHNREAEKVHQGSSSGISGMKI